jgi:hypothetical protein
MCQPKKIINNNFLSSRPAVPRIKVFDCDNNDSRSALLKARVRISDREKYAVSVVAGADFWEHQGSGASDLTPFRRHVYDGLPHGRPVHNPQLGAAALLGLSPDRDHIPLQGGVVKFLFVEQQQDQRSLADCVVGKIHGKENKKSTGN